MCAAACRRVTGISSHGKLDRALDHAEDETDHPEFAVESVGRGHEPRRHERSYRAGARPRDLGHFRRVLRVSELHGEELLGWVAPGISRALPGSRITVEDVCDDRLEAG